MARTPATDYNATMRVLIIGCGYVGLPLGAELVRLGHDTGFRIGNQDLTVAFPVAIIWRGNCESAGPPFFTSPAKCSR